MERFCIIINNYYCGFYVVVFVYSVDEFLFIYYLGYWIWDLEEFVLDVLKIFIGNKKDLDC